MRRQSQPLRKRTKERPPFLILMDCGQEDRGKWESKSTGFPVPSPPLNFDIEELYFGLTK